MKRAVILIFFVPCLMLGQGKDERLSFANVKTMLDDRMPAAIINPRIAKWGIDFPATQEIQRQLKALHIESSTWALIVKAAPPAWERLFNSPPEVRQMAFGNETLLAVNGRNEVYLSADHGASWLEFPVWKGETKFRVLSVAACENPTGHSPQPQGHGVVHWIAGGASLSGGEGYLFRSDTGREWEQIFFSGYNPDDSDAFRYRVPFTCQGNSVFASNGSWTKSSADGGKNWDPLLNASARLFAYSDGLAAAVLEHQGKFQFCHQDSPDNPKLWKCESWVPEAASFAKIGQTLCLGHADSAKVSVSGFHGQTWNEHAVLQDPALDGVISLLPVGTGIYAATGNNGVFFGDQTCDNWKLVGEDAPTTGVTSLTTDGRYLYAGTNQGIFRWALPVSNSGHTYDAPKGGEKHEQH